MKSLNILATIFLVSFAIPAWACSCMPDTNGTLAAQTLADPSISVADVYVRGMNMRNGQSMLEIKNIHHGGLMAQNIRAKFDRSSCGVIPQYKQNMTLLIKAENDATYSIVGNCAHDAVMQNMKKGN